jgi:hypothetical protein
LCFFGGVSNIYCCSEEDKIEYNGRTNKGGGIIEEEINSGIIGDDIDFSLM